MRVHHPEISEDMDGIVLKCLNKERLLRYQTAIDLSSDLDKVRQGHAVAAKPQQKAVTDEKRGAENRSLRATESVYRKFIAWTGAAIVIALSVGGIAGVALWKMLQPERMAQPSAKEVDHQSIEHRGLSASPADNEPNPVAIPPKSALEEKNQHTTLRHMTPASPHRSSSAHTVQSQVTQAKTSAQRAHKPHTQAFQTPASPGGWDQLKEMRTYK
jgi:hypothetical protein